MYERENLKVKGQNLKLKGKSKNLVVPVEPAPLPVSLADATSKYPPSHSHRVS
jgi:hypothetical protein